MNSCIKCPEISISNRYDAININKRCPCKEGFFENNSYICSKCDDNCLSKSISLIKKTIKKKKLKDCIIKSDFCISCKNGSNR
jgi:hypothetical protein